MKMKDTTFLILVVIILLLTLPFLCFWTGYWDDFEKWVNPDIDKDDEEDEEDEEDQEQEVEEDDDHPPPCSTVRFSKSTDGIETTWTAIGMPEATYLDATSQLMGGYKYQGYWNWNFLGHISDTFTNKASLYNNIQTYYPVDISSEQLWWYECMLLTPYGQVP